MKSYTIHFVRHGLTEANEAGIYSGSSDYPLSERGKENIFKLTQEYKYPDAPIMYCSPLTRCIETAKIIYPDKTPIIVEQLSECNFGDWEGKMIKDLVDDPTYNSWLVNWDNATPPGGESGVEFRNRVCTAFESIVTAMMKTGNTNAIIVTHGGVIMSLMSTFSPEKVEFYDWIVDNGCGYSVRITPSLWMRDKIVEVYQKVPIGHNCSINGNFKAIIDKARSKAKGGKVAL